MKRAFKKIPVSLKKFLYMKEMAEHKLFSKNSKMKVYFLYSPWQRGTNENTNGLIRQFFGRDFSKVSR